MTTIAIHTPAQQRTLSFGSGFYIAWQCCGGSCGAGGRDGTISPRS